MNAKTFISENWEKTYRTPSVCGERITLPKPFTVPSINQGFNNFYYWDTCFTNVGLLLSGKIEQAKNNIDNIAYCIKKFGFMPNADHLPQRSQPPLFAYAIKDYYQASGDKTVPAEFAPVLEKELAFWERERTDEKGLSFYGFTADDEYLTKFYGSVKRRVNLDTDSPETTLYDGKNLLAIAESGWDFTHRFTTEKSVVDAQSFRQVDLNCLLFYAENVCAELYKLCANEKKAEEFTLKAEKRKALINEYMLCGDGIYRDYDALHASPAHFTSCASYLPYFVGVSNDKISYEKLTSVLEREEGLAATEKIENGYQWDFPNMWPPLVFFAIRAGENCKATETVKRLATKYLNTADRVFEKSGQLYEKYDSVTGVLPEKSEYGTPPMMGWTAATYLYLDKNYRG